MEKRGALGRTGSSIIGRVKGASRRSVKLGRKILPDTPLHLAEREILAIRAGDSEPFWLCRVMEEVKPSTKEVDVIWLEPDGKYTDKQLYSLGTEDTINVDTILSTVVTEKHSSSSKYYLSEPERARLEKLVKDDKLDPEALAAQEAAEAAEAAKNPAPADNVDWEATKKKLEEEDSSMPSDDSSEDAVIPVEKKRKTPTKRGRGGASTRGRGRGAGTRASRAAKSDKSEASEGDAEGTPKKTRKRKAEGELKESPAKRGRGRGGKATTPRKATPGKRSRVASVHEDIAFAEIDPMWESKDDNILNLKDSWVASRELFRAVQTKNVTLAQKIFAAGSKVADLWASRSADMKITAFHEAIMKNDLEFLKLFDNEATHPTARVPYPNVTFKAADTGVYNRRTFRHRVAAITGARGGKEGNDAFLHDQDIGIDRTEELPEEVSTCENISLETVKFMSVQPGLMSVPFSNHLGEICQYGNLKLASSVVKQMVLEDNGLNNLHLYSLTFTNEELPQFRAVSVQKKPYENMGVTPLHMACINPNAKYLKAMLQVLPNVHLKDTLQRSLVHYAAACSGTGPLNQLFLTAGDSGVLFREGDRSGTTPLMIAAMMGRIENMKILFAKEALLLAAAEDREAEAEKEAGGDAGDGDEKMGEEGAPAPAAAEKEAKAGDDAEEKDEEMAIEPESVPTQTPSATPAPFMDDEDEEEEEAPKFTGRGKGGRGLGKGGARRAVRKPRVPKAEKPMKPKKVAGKMVDAVDGLRDAKGYSALHYACHFNRAEAVRYLLEQGSKISKGARKTKLAPLHVAAQQGHLDIVKILLTAKATVDALDGKKRTPLMLAVMNGHLKVASYLMHMGANFDAVDSSSNSVAHYAAAYGWEHILEYLIKVGAAINVNNDWKVSVLAAAMGKGHIGCASILLDQKSIDVNVRDDEGCTLIAQATKQPITEAALENLEFLISKGANPLIPDGSGLFPIHHLAARCPVLAAQEVPSSLMSVWDDAMKSIGVTPQNQYNHWNYVTQTYQSSFDIAAATKRTHDAQVDLYSRAMAILIKYPGASINALTQVAGGTAVKLDIPKAKPQKAPHGSDSEEYSEEEDDSESIEDEPAAPTPTDPAAPKQHRPLDLALQRAGWEIVGWMLKQGAECNDASSFFDSLFTSVQNDPELAIQVLSLFKESKGFKTLLNHVDDHTGCTPLLTLLQWLPKFSVKVPSSYAHQQHQQSFKDELAKIQTKFEESIFQFCMAFLNCHPDVHVKVEKMLKWRVVEEIPMEEEKPKFICPGIGYSGETIVLLSDGTTKALKDLNQKKDTLMGYNADGTFRSTSVPTYVTGKTSDMVDIHLNNGQKLQVHPTSKFYVKDKGWCSPNPAMFKKLLIRPPPIPDDPEDEPIEETPVPVEKLEVGDVVFQYKRLKQNKLRFGLEEVKIEQISEEYETDVETYNIQESHQSFFVNGIISQGISVQHYQYFYQIMKPAEPPVEEDPIPKKVVERPPAEEDRYPAHGKATVLHFLCFLKTLPDLRDKLTQYFLEHKVDLEARTLEKDGAKTPFQTALEQQLWEYAALFVKAGCQVNVLGHRDKIPTVAALFHQAPTFLTGDPHLQAVAKRNLLNLLLPAMDLKYVGPDNSTYLHNAARVHDIQSFQNLLSRGANPDAQDKNGDSAFHLVMRWGTNTSDDSIRQLLKKANCNLANKAGETPFQMAVSNHSYYLIGEFISNKANVKTMYNGQPMVHIALGRQTQSIIEDLLKAGEDVNVQDGNGDTLLHLASKMRHEDFVTFFLKRGSKTAITNKQGQTVLHYAINYSTSGIDSSFALERMLLEAGVDVNVTDKWGRTALHYMFTDIGKGVGSSTSKIDPVDTLSGLCNAPGIKIDVQDKYGRAPLHYAAARGATICSNYLLKRDAKLNSLDKAKNTPLAIGLMNNHPDYGITLIHAKANIMNNIHFESRSWKITADKKGFIYKREKSLDVRIWTLFRQVVEHEWTGVAYTLLDNDFDFFLALEDAILAKRLNFMNTLLEKTMDNKLICRKNPSAQTLIHALCNFSDSLSGKPWNKIMTRLLAAGVDSNAIDSFGNSALHYVCKHLHNDLLHLLIQRKANVNENDKQGDSPFIIALKNLKRDSSLFVVRQLFAAGAKMVNDHENISPLVLLVHRQRGAYIQDEMDLLLQKGADPNAKSKLGNPVLCDLIEHYSVPQLYDLIETFFRTAKGTVDVNAPNKNGDTPVVLFMRKFYGGQMEKAFKFVSTLTLLLNKGANVNLPFEWQLTYPAHLKTGGNKKKKVVKWPLLVHAVELNTNQRELASNILTVLLSRKDVDLNVTDEEGNTPLVRAWNNQPASGNAQILQENIMTQLLTAGANPNIPDKNGQTLLMKIIQKNDMKNLDLLLASKRIPLGVNDKDRNGKSPLHHCVNPLVFGSYENTEMLQKLIDHGANVNIQDQVNRPPLFYALMQDSGRMAAVLTAAGAKQMPTRPMRETSVLPQTLWDSTAVALDQDFDEIDKEMGGAAETKYVPTPDQYLPSQFKFKEVHVSKDGVAYDIIMTKTDVKYGEYGLNNFYVMQVIHETVKDIYLLLNRWGRNGEPGQVQCTPMGSCDDACAEFAKIFKTKAGNTWPCTVETFVKQPKKWNLQAHPVKKDYTKVQLKPWDLEKCAFKSTLAKPVQSVLSQITEPKLLARSLENSGIALPLSQFTKPVIDQALFVLAELLNLAKAAQAEQGKAAIDIDIDMLTKSYDKMNELSNEFFTLVPHKDYSFSSFQPLTTVHLIEQKITLLTGLSDISTASKILMAATKRMDTMHPFDYVYRATNLQIEHIPRTSEEFKALYSYATVTSQRSAGVRNIFRIQRKGEPERMEKFKGLENHFLLWHGSKVSNFLGIFSEGLRVAPPNAPVSGYAFGKGIYFADMLSKSMGYTDTSSTGSQFVLLCEVALGNIKQLEQSDWNTTATEPYHSCQALGQTCPDFKKSIVLPNGVTIPVGPVENHSHIDTVPGHEGQPPKRRNFGYNEYIVYNNAQVRLRYLVELGNESSGKY